MSKALFGSIPSGFALLYLAGQRFAYSGLGKMYFSSTFLPKIIAFAVLGALYIFLAIRIDRSKYLRSAIVGLVVGLVVFVGSGIKLFFDFEFARDLSI